MIVQSIADFFDKSCWRIFLCFIGKVTTGIKKNPDKEPPAIMFLARVGQFIQSGHMESCLAAQKRFLLFKRQGSFKKNFFNRRNCRGSIGISTDTTRIHPPWSFYCTFNKHFFRVLSTVSKSA